MESGGTRQAVLVAAALAASAVLAAWWWSASLHRPDVASTFPKAARAEAANREAVNAAHGSVARPLDRPASAASIDAAPAAPPLEVESARSHVGVSDTVSSAPKAGEESGVADAKPSSPVADEPASEESDISGAEHSGQEPVADVANSSAGKPEADAVKIDGAPSAEGGNAAPGSAVDADHITDLFADLFGKIDSGDRPDYASQSLDMHKFDARETGGDGERALEQALRGRFSEWIATLPPDIAQHVLLVSVDCHVEECRVLLAQNGIDFRGRSPQDTSDPLAVMDAAIWSFLGERLSQQQQWRVISNSWSAAGGDQLDTALRIILLGYEAP